MWQAIGPRQGAREGVSWVTTGATIAHIVFTIGATGISGGGYSSSSLSSGWGACGTHNISVSPSAGQWEVRKENVLRKVPQTELGILAH